MKRKKIAILFGAAITILHLTACGEVEGIGEATSGSTETQMSSSEKQNEPDRKENEDAEDTSSTEESKASDTEAASVPQSGNKTGQSEKFKTDATIEETVLIDENDVKITATDLSYTSHSVKLNVTIENNSDKDLSFHSGTMAYSSNSINGYMIDGGYMAADVAAGKKAKDSISFDTQELSIYGITEIADIQIGFTISDDDYESMYFEPRQVRTSVADTYDYETDTYRQAISSGTLAALSGSTIDYFAEETLYDQNGVQLVSQAILTNKDGDKMLLLEMENTSSDSVVARASDLFINGLLISDSNLVYELINPGARRILGISLTYILDVDWWEAYGAASIDELRFSVSLDDSDDNEIAAPEELCVSISENPVLVDDSGEELYNENGIRFISKGIKEDIREYSDDLHMLFLLQNNSDQEIYVQYTYNSLSINGFMSDGYFYDTDVPSGEFAIIDIRISNSALEDIDITEIADISEAEISFEVKDGNYDTIAEPTLSIQY